jgi:predicted DsbA family dithiol-disulfide isomerase
MDAVCARRIRMSGSTGRAAIEVQMIADLACPWCYIGFRRLQRARALRPALEVRIRWWPFLLNPHLPPEGMDRAAYVRMKFGGDAAAAKIYARITEAGREEGIPFAFERMRRTPNSVQAQRLVLHAEDQGRGEPLLERLFQALFVDGVDLGDHGALAEVAVAAGLDRAASEALLADRAQADEILRGHVQAERLGVRGVPVFVVGRRHAISGAQPPEVLAGLLDLAAVPEAAEAADG